MTQKSTNKTNLPSLILLLTSIAIGASAWAQMAPKSTDSMTRSTTMALPTTPQEIWNRILILLSRNEGYVSKQDVEEVIGMQFTHSERDGELRKLGAEYFHSFNQDVSGLGVLDLGLFEDPKMIHLNAEWGMQNADRQDCPNLPKAIADLKTLGWETFQLMPAPNSRVLVFHRTRDITESQKPGGKPLNAPNGISHLFLVVPYRLSQCVVGCQVGVYP